MLELFHAAPSYYSMVARLALAEAGVAYVSRLMDIHLAKQQLSPAYRKLNPHMTVPTLRGPGLLLTDSAQILIYAAQQAAQRPEQSWADVDASRAEAIQRAVAGHYALSIETLTFGKVLATRPWFKAVMVRMLSGINAKLERDIAGKPDQAALLEAKVQQNRARLAVFRDRPAPAVLAEQQDQVAAYLASLPPVVASGWLFGARISSADVVLAVLCSRLAMAGELALLSRADLQSWWQRYQQRPAFAAADLWTRFQRRRFVQSLLEARHTRFS
ncbi:glutathione S-transferase family protein [Vulcanococcus sp. Clear-D1]|jgi:tetrachloro-p-hydroquinone reductive dehalogenase|uniref:glutathione S-transferase family protein n=1 Tax=Vulcanococcus sp. Clear-D1 TaxID=2766970 RepID=UPI00198938AE|nr:glutathione S-transferase family protein [Vulcanococcus sp. Clear-D1]MBD1193534.1 glutathione S-transferase family protein [Vulcanococcus sp. Clear-D1]